MRYGSLFSGIGGFDLGFDRADMTCAWQVEKDEKARNVLTTHWPEVPKYEDIKDVGKRNLESVDLVCGGFPCQDVSVAGRREGLAGERSGLWFEFRRIVEELTPEWVVIENVPGLLSSCGCLGCQAIRRILRVHRRLRYKRKISVKCPVCVAGEKLLKSHRGRDLALILHGLEELGYWWAYRVLDAQNFGVPQRRRRVFIVASFTRGRPQEVLFESESSPWDTPPSRETRAELARDVAATIKGGSGERGYPLEWEAGLTVSHTEIHGGSKRKDRPNGGFYTRDMPTTKPLDTSGLNPACAQGGSLKCFAPQAGGNTGLNINKDMSGTLQENQVMAVAYDGRNLNDTGPGWWRDGIGTLRERDYKDASNVICNIGGPDDNDVQVNQGAGVRRLTPLECERLQGFPDHHTADQSDSARYRQLGNAVAVPVAEWLGRRMLEVI